jgi:hypothetical protein
VIKSLADSLQAVGMNAFFQIHSFLLGQEALESKEFQGFYFDYLSADFEQNFCLSHMRRAVVFYDSPSLWVSLDHAYVLR